MSLKLRADLLLAFIAAIWGSTFVVVKAALEDSSVVLFLALRFTLAAAALAILFRRRIWPDRISLRNGSTAGMFLIAGYVLQTTGLRYTTSAKSGFLTGLYIVLVPLLAAIVYKIVPGWREWTGIGLAAAGMALMTLDNVRLTPGRGELLTIACAFAFAAHILVLGHFARVNSTEILSFWQIAVGAGMCWIAVWLLEKPFVRWTPQLVGAIVLTGLVGTAFVFVAQTWAQKYTTPTRAALLFALEPVFAALTGVLMAGEALTGQAIAGSLLILTGIIRVELKPSLGT